LSTRREFSPLFSSLFFRLSQSIASFPISILLYLLLEILELLPSNAFDDGKIFFVALMADFAIFVCDFGDLILGEEGGTTPTP